MAAIELTPQFVKSATCTAGKRKMDIHDSYCKGLLLEVRVSGNKTYSLTYTNNRGTRRQTKLGDERDITLAQARALADKHRGQIAMGEDPTATKTILRQVPTFAKFIAERYLPFIMGYKRSWKSDESYLKTNLLPAFGKKHLDQITKHDVIQFHHGMMAKGYAAGTCNRCLILLRYIMNLAIKWEIPGITVNPTKDVALFEDFNKPERFLTEMEAQRLYESVQQSINPMLQYIVPMLILTGARKREVLDAKWVDFNLLKKQWRIPTTKSGQPRYVPMSEGVLQLLAAIPHERNSQWVFPNPKTHLPYRTIFATWNTARKLAGLADLRLHDLRHSFASFLVNAGRSLYEVQKILGHTQIRTTQRYAHLSQDTLLAAANEVPLILDMPVKTPLALPLTA
ncbi:tyrosine recombinase XerC [mine drainage metagenome]|uniref:Tyrosine recombinase XerC n=1 Tax=mine drainage metagenome TaxID=410659 RepID=A0A1J5PP22_9ZZZZ